MKTCRACKKEKPLTEFYKNSKTSDTYRLDCKECMHVRHLRWMKNPTKEMAIKYRWSSLRRGAKKRSVDFGLDFDFCAHLLTEQCYYCGGMDVWRGQKINSLDRVDSSDGYLPENVVPCCFTCNRAKNNMSLTEFEAWIDRLLTYRQEV